MTRVLAVLLLVASVVAAATTASSATPDAPATVAATARTWVVDAVDDVSSNRWESVDSGTSVVTVAVGDTVEWQFDRATQGHDLVSRPPVDPWDTAWSQPLEEYRDAGGEPVRVTFDQPGTYRYECSLHGTMMSGTVVVVAPDGNQPPTAEPVVEPMSGPAPLAVHATAAASDPDGDVVAVAWDFGTGAAPTRTDHAMFDYTSPGTYVVRLRVSDGRGGLLVRDFPVTVTDGTGPTPEPTPTGTALPEVDAQATPAAGTAPLAVAFSTQVTTRGTLHAYSAGLDSDPAITGEAVMVRRRGQTRTVLQVAGARPGTAHPSVHVHEKPCADELGGAHFRFDTAQPFAEANEIWPVFTTDASGAAAVEVVKPLRAGPLAVSVVVHDPTNAARRIGCADLAPGTADLTYAWTFGDGTTGAGADPDHTYAAPGTYAATVTVTRGTTSVSDTVQVVVGAAPTAPPAAGPAEDRTGPRISRVRPRRAVRDTTPTVSARVRDRDSHVRPRSVVLRLDGRRVRGARFDADRGVVRWTPQHRLAPGRHVVRLVARDASGNRTARTWRFTLRR